jgi:hypothetical protein
MNSRDLAASISAGEQASTDADSLAAVILAVVEGLEAQWLIDDFVNPVRGAQTLRAFIRRCRMVQRGDEVRPGRGRRLSGLGDRRWSVRQRTSGQVATSIVFGRRCCSSGGRLPSDPSALFGGIH